MITADYITIGALALFAILGAILGFAKGLKSFSHGILGFLSSLIICYAIFGLVLKIQVINDWLTKLVDKIPSDGFWSWTRKCRIDMIIFAILLFVVVHLLKKLVIALLSKMFSSSNVFVRVINMVCGIVLYCGILIAIALIAFQVIYQIGNGFSVDFASYLDGSKLKLDKFYASNPLNIIVDNYKYVIGDTSYLPSLLFR